MNNPSTHNPRRALARDARGFSLMELMVVCMLIGIVLVVATPSFVRYRISASRRAACVQLIEDLRAARQMAVTMRTPVVVSFGNGSATTNVGSYKVHNDKNYNGAVEATERVLSNTMPKNTVLSTVSLTPTDSLIFDISGLLRMGTSGGSLIVKTGTNTGVKYDTLQVSIAGVIYKP